MLKRLGAVVLLVGATPTFAADLTGRYVTVSNGATTNFSIQETADGVTGQLVGSDVGSLTGTRSGWFVDGQVEIVNIGTFPIRLVDFGPWGVEFTLTGNNGPVTFVLQPDNNPEVVVDVPPHGYLLRDVDTFGPVTVLEIKALLDSGELDGNSFAWIGGLSSWTLIQDIPELAAMLSTKPDRPTPELRDPLAAILDAQVAQQLSFYDQPTRDGIVVCGMQVFAPLSAADRQVLIDTDINPAADFSERNPGVIDRLFACAAPETVGGVPRSSYQLFDGRVFAVSGPEPHTLTVVAGGATFTVGDSTFTFADDKLTFNGQRAELEPFERSLEIQVSPDGETAKLVYDQ